jgi:RNA recognition motif. (a.k.a. RRM, RBD, or RNP domain)
MRSTSSRPLLHLRQWALQNRADRPKGDVNSTWSHDLFEDTNTLSLSDRLTATRAAAPPRPNITSSIAQRALRDATGASDGQLSIKGASTSVQGGNVVEVTGLVRGTTPDDVCTIFKRCGAISNAKSVPSAPAYHDCVTVRVTFKSPASAAAAVQKFHNQPADGKTLNVKIVGSASAGTTLGGRLGGVDGLGIVRQEGSVDVLMDSNTEDTGS